MRVPIFEWNDCEPGVGVQIDAPRQENDLKSRIEIEQGLKERDGAHDLIALAVVYILHNQNPLPPAAQASARSSSCMGKSALQ